MLLLFLATLPGCARYRISTPQLAEKGYAVELHPLYQIVPRHRCQIRPLDCGHWLMWALFGNDDDGLFGEKKKGGYHPEWPAGGWKACCWWLRNPLHNFCFYVIGSAAGCNREIDLLTISRHGVKIGGCRMPGRTEFPCRCSSSLYLALHGGKPFLSLRIIHSQNRKTDLYLGWRSRGNFGIKANIFVKRKADRAP